MKPQTYASAVQVMHWTMGAGVLTCFGTVQAAMNTTLKKKKDEWGPQHRTLGKTKMEWMKLHKSTALLVAALVPARLGLRLVKEAPAHIPDATPVVWAAKLSHAAFYGFIVALPTSGIAMGYFGGKGLPFFEFGTIPGAATPNGAIAGQAFKIHKQAGEFFQYLTLAHLGGVGYHLVRGHPVLARMGLGSLPAAK